MDVLYEDEYIIIINKKAGQIVQSDKTGDKALPEIIKEWLKVRSKIEGDVFCGVTHRLDRPTSGIVVFARTSTALAQMNELFRKDEVAKTYWAVVRNCPKKEEDTLKNYLWKNEKQNKSYISDKDKQGAKLAILNYKLKAKSDTYFLLEVNLETGRHHQIRCQFAEIGSPIKGDLKYGAKRSNPDGSISLHARTLSFMHPVSKKLIEVIAPVPNDSLWKVLEENVALD